jgi:pyruvate/2-oxoglutarate dehydrogenase complex dihydrolipoamide dehydrogenase (E3) component
LGAELAQAFHRLGSRVTIIEMGEHLLGREDSDAVQILQETFMRESIGLLLNTKPKRVFRTDVGKVIIYEREGVDERLVVDDILIGTGRVPNVEGLNLEAAGVESDRKDGILVNDNLQTTNPRIYAAGDVCLKYKFTHMADAAARIVIQNGLFLGRKKLSALTIPWVTYTDPEIAHVGMYVQDAKERGIEVETFVKPLSEVDRAVVDGEEEGFVKIHVRKGTDRIVGATIVARHAGEMIGEIGLAMVCNLGLKAIAGVIHPYPTQAEAVGRVADMYNRTRLTPFIKRITSFWLSLGRLDGSVALSRYLHRARVSLWKTGTSLWKKRMSESQER